MSVTPTFAAPAEPSTGVKWADLDGELLLIEPETVSTVSTSLGEREAVHATVHVITGDDAGTTHPDALIFPKVLLAQLRQQLGEHVLGRLGQGKAKPGQSAPWRLMDCRKGDPELALSFLADRDQAPAQRGALY
jgi:hypothetical protein